MRTGTQISDLFPMSGYGSCLFIIGLLLTSCASHPDSSSAGRRIDYYGERAKGPGAYPAYARLGLALLDRFRETGDEKDYTAALTNLQQSLSYQRNFEALLGMARALAERHRFYEALPYAREAAETMPSNAEAPGTLFDIQLGVGDAAGAAETLARIPAPGFVASTRGAALAEYQGNYAAARNHMDQAAEVSGGLTTEVRAWCQVRAGALSMFLGDAIEARRRYREALRIQPDYFFANEHLAEWHAAHGHWREAAELYGKLLKEHSDPGYQYARAEALAATGRVAEGQRLVDEAIRELRKNVASGAIDHQRELAIMLLCEKREPEEALKLAQRDRELRNDAATEDTLAWALSAAGRNEEAVQLSRRALQVSPNHPAILLHGAIIQARAGNRDEAARLVERAKKFQLAFTVFERKALKLAMEQP